MRLVRHHGPRDDLRELGALAPATNAELAQIRQLLAKVDVTSGRVLMREGAFGDQFMIIVDGTAEVTRHGEQVATLGRGDVVGEAALLDQSGRGRRNATVRALTDLTVYVGSRAEFRQMLDVAPSVAENIWRTASARVPQAA